MGDDGRVFQGTFRLLLAANPPLRVKRFLRARCVFLKEVLGLLYRMNTDLQHLYLYEIYHLNNATADLSRRSYKGASTK